MGEVLQRRFKDLVFRRIELMKGLHRTVASDLVGGVTGALMGATAFLAVDVLMPSTAEAACYSEQCNPYSEYQNPYSEHQNPYSKYQNPYSKYQNPYSSDYIPSCKKTGAC